MKNVLVFALLLTASNAAFSMAKDVKSDNEQAAVLFSKATLNDQFDDWHFLPTKRTRLTVKLCATQWLAKTRLTKAKKQQATAQGHVQGARASRILHDAGMKELLEASKKHDEELARRTEYLANAEKIQSSAKPMLVSGRKVLILQELERKALLMEKMIAKQNEMIAFYHKKLQEVELALH